MKYLFIFLLFSVTALAESYQVTHRGHTYTFNEGPSSSSLKSKKFSFEIPNKDCSRTLLKNLSSSFQEKLKPQTTSSKNALEIKMSGKSIFVPEGHKNGRYLASFPDHFAKTYLTFKEICK